MKWTITTEHDNTEWFECCEDAAYLHAEKYAIQHPNELVMLWSDDPSEDYWYACMADSNGELIDSQTILNEYM